MTNYKLEITDFFSPDFELIAIHSKIENYRLAFFLNKMLSIGFIKCDDEVVQLKKGETFCFSKFIFEDQENQTDWILVENIQSKQHTEQFGNLFMDFENVKTSYLLPELKKVDYLLKIEGVFDSDLINDTLEKIKDINQVQLAYVVDMNQVKSKSNLIF